MLAGFALILLGAIMNGSFAAPMKRTRGWAWEHSWLVWAITGLVVFPAVAVVLTVPGVVDIYRLTSWRSISIAALFGFLWGIASVLFGLGVDRLGLALGFGIIIGISSALGAIVPLLTQHPEQLGVPTGQWTLAGVGLVLLGVSACALAGRLREKAGVAARRGSLAGGLILCLLSSIGAPMINFGLAFGSEIIENARRLTAASVHSVNAIWPVLLAAGFVPNAAYCAYLISRRSSWPALARVHPGGNWRLGASMGLLWYGSNLAYGYGSQAVGDLGLVLGWPVFMGCIVLTANIWGALTGEWVHAPRRAIRVLLAGVALLIAGVSLIGYASGAAGRT